MANVWPKICKHEIGAVPPQAIWGNLWYGQVHKGQITLLRIVVRALHENEV